MIEVPVRASGQSSNDLRAYHSGPHRAGYEIGQRQVPVFDPPLGLCDGRARPAGLWRAVFTISQQADKASDPDALGPGNLTRTADEAGKRELLDRCYLLVCDVLAACLLGYASAAVARCCFQHDDLAQLLLCEAQHMVDLYVTAGMGDGVIHGGIMAVAKIAARQMSQAESNVRQGVGFGVMLPAIP